MSAIRSSVSSMPSRDARETLTNRVAPACPAVHRTVDAAEAGRRDEQVAVLRERMHGRRALELDRHDSAETLHLSVGDLVRRVVGEARDSAPTARRDAYATSTPRRARSGIDARTADRRFRCCAAPATPRRRQGSGPRVDARARSLPYGRDDSLPHSPREGRGDPTMSWWRSPPRDRRRVTAVAAQKVSRWCCRRRVSRRGAGTSSPGDKDRPRRARGSTVFQQTLHRRPTRRR